VLQQFAQARDRPGACVAARNGAHLGHGDMQFQIILLGVRCSGSLQDRSSTRPAYRPVKCASASQTLAPFTYTWWMPRERSMGVSKVAASATVAGSKTTRSANAFGWITPRSARPNRPAVRPVIFQTAVSMGNRPR